MSYRTVTPDEAKKILDENKDSVYVDVRSTVEFEEGHAAGAHNIPVADLNPVTGQMEPNRDFEDVILGRYPKDARLILACAAGGRSRAACETLAARGFENLVNMHGGFLGARDPYGNLIQEGWKALGFPSASGQDEGETYASIKETLQKDPPAGPS